MKLCREAVALVLVLVALVVCSFSGSASAQAVNPGLTVASLKQSCMNSGAAGAPKVYRRAIFTFFEEGSIRAGATKLGISTSEFSRQVVFGIDELKVCTRQRISVSSR